MIILLSSLLLAGGIVPRRAPKWAVKILPITQEWRLNVCTDSNERVDQAKMWIRVYRRVGTRFTPMAKSRSYPTPVAYPDHYRVIKIRGESVWMIVGDWDTHMNCFYNVWAFRPKTAALKLVAHELMNLDSADASRGVLLEAAGSQFVENHGDPGLKHMIARRWRYDRQKNRLVPGKWFNDPQFN